MDIDDGGSEMTDLPRKVRSVRIPRRAIISFLSAAATLILVLLLWQVIITTSTISTYQAKTPIDVWRYLFVDGAAKPVSAADRRADLVPIIAVTVFHAAVGLIFGVTAATVGAIVLSLSSTARAMFLPIALVLQTVPLIAMAPVIFAVFGSGVLTAAVVAAIVTLFPLMMNIRAGLSSASPETIELVHAYGGGRRRLLWHVQLPAALPSLFAGLKIAAPATVSAATLYEFLFSFEGLGANLLTSKSYSNYPLLWTLVAVTVALALAAYALAALVERLVLSHRYPPTRTHPSRRGGAS